MHFQPTYNFLIYIHIYSSNHSITPLSKKKKEERRKRMYNNSRRRRAQTQVEEESFVVIQVRGGGEERQRQKKKKKKKADIGGRSSGVDFTAMKLFNRFRKIVMRFIFSVSPSSRGSGSGGGGSGSRYRGDELEPPKTSCSSYYSSNSHYSEAIADCIEFFNKSSSSSREFDEQDGRNIVRASISDVLV